MPLHRLYELAINARNTLYEKGVFKAYSLGALTVSVGNITVGGTGKTPLVAFVAGILAETGEKVCILTRGYGRKNPRARVVVSDGENILTDAAEAGDEPIELARKLGDKAVIVADANRAAAGVWARGKYWISAFVLDDAFQHRRVARHINIVCIDATNPFGNGKALPTGILREPLKNLKRADVVVITRANLVKDVSSLQPQIAKYNPHCPIFISKNKIARLIDLKSFALNKSEDLPDFNKTRTANKFLAFCALGNPNNFFEQLRGEKFNIAAVEKFPDHHFYSQSDIEKLIEKARQNGAEMLVTTAKDAVKLKDLTIDFPCFVAESELIFDDKSDFRSWLIDNKNRAIHR